MYAYALRWDMSRVHMCASYMQIVCMSIHTCIRRWCLFTSASNYSRGVEAQVLFSRHNQCPWSLLTRTGCEHLYVAISRWLAEVMLVLSLVYFLMATFKCGKKICARMQISICVTEELEVGNNTSGLCVCVLMRGRGVNIQHFCQEH